jgi:hypothetical protein
MRENEAKCCDAVIRHLETMHNVRRSGIQSPEEDDSVQLDERIDVILDIGGVSYAIEHTLIEPYHEHRKGGILARELEAELKRVLPSHRYEYMDILLPSTWHRNLSRRKDRSAFALAIAIKLEENEEIVSRWRGQADEHWERFCELCGIPIQIQFRKEDFDLGGLTVIHLATHPKAERLDRIQRAFFKKIPKLMKYKNKGYRTILVLENNDICLTNWQIVQEHISNALVVDHEIPDYLYFINACHSTWYLHPFLEDGKDNSRQSDGRVRVVRFTEQSLSVSLHAPQTSNSSTNRAFS